MFNVIKYYKPRVVLAFLLLFHLGLLSLQTKNREGTPLLKVWLINVNAPVIHGIERASQSVEYVWRKYFYLRGLYDENQYLKQQVAHLQLQSWKYEEIGRENQRLSELLRVKEQIPYQAEGARVVIKKPSFFSQSIFIDKGANYELEKNMPVVSVESLVGRIISVGRTLSEVQLITNAGAAANAVIEARQVRGVINGNGGELLDLKYVGAEAKVEPGDLVITFGMDGTYPKGLPIGTVVRVQPSSTIYKDIKVKPATNIWRLEDILVLTNK